MNAFSKNNDRGFPRYRPATDIVEREDGFHIFMDLPGVKKDDLSIDLKDDELIVSGRVELDQGDNEHFTEAQFGNCEYVRSVSVTDIVDREAIQANLDNGVLELLLPKVEKIQPQRITITQG